MKTRNVCGSCFHARSNLGIIESLGLRSKLKETMDRLQTPCEAEEQVTIDEDLFEVLMLLNKLSKQKFYCKTEKGWVHLFDVACYAWSPKPLQPAVEKSPNNRTEILRFSKGTST